MNSPFRFAVVVLAAVSLVGLGWGLASATTSTPQYARACVTSKSALVLSDNGTCRKGLRPVKVPLSTAIGPRGPQGVQGVQGVQGPAGGLQGFTRVVSAMNSIAAGSFGPTTATCPGTSQAIGGGEVADGGNGTDVIASYPVSNSQWLVTVYNNTGGSEDVWAYATCANVTG
jgi:hypothetical protein